MAAVAAPAGVCVDSTASTDIPRILLAAAVTQRLDARTHRRPF
jgi:hypothetical protein